MATVVWPSDILITRHEIQPINPSQIVHEVPGINSVQVFETGYGTWQGASELAVRPDGRSVEAFISSLNGQANIVEMPLLRETVGGGDVAITSATGNAYTLASRPDKIAAGVYVRSGNRVFIVETVGRGATPVVTLWPYFPLTTSSTVGPANTIRVRSRAALVMQRRRGFYGPWTLRWTEAAL